MINNGSSENHQINNLKCIITFAKYLAKDIKFYDIKDKVRVSWIEGKKLIPDEWYKFESS